MLNLIKNLFIIHIPQFFSNKMNSIFKPIKWRIKNRNNSTRMNSDFRITSVDIGNKSYGPLNVFNYGSSEEHLFIGNYVSIADNVCFILGGNHPYSGFSTYPFKVVFFGHKAEAMTKGPIIIEDDVWIGHGSIILSGVKIGQGAIVAAGSVVTKNVPIYSIVGGNPATVIKYRFSDKIIEALAEIDYSLINKEHLMRNKEILYTTVNDENYQDIIAKLTNFK